MRGATDIHARPTREWARQARRIAKSKGFGIGAQLVRWGDECMQRSHPECWEAVRSYRLAQAEEDAAA